MNCPYCTSDNVISKGFRISKKRYNCKNCGKYFTEDADIRYINNRLSTPLGKMISVPDIYTKQVIQYLVEFGDTETIKKFKITNEKLEEIKTSIKFNETKIPKILLMDIETTPMTVYVWGLFKQHISHKNVIKDWNIVSWSAKWLFSSQMMGDVLTPEESMNRDDSRIIQGLWKLFDECDILIGHNCNKFDVRKCNSRFILHGLKPPMPYKTIDTLKIAQKYFAFSSNRLDYIGKLIENKGKLETDFELWIKCLEGDEKSLDYMFEYNKEDVLLLEDAYLFLRPYIKSHPNVGIYAEANENMCGNCGSLDLTWGGSYSTLVSTFNAYRCNACGAIGRGRKSVLTKKQKEKLTVSVAF